MKKVTKKIIKMLGGYVWDELPWAAKMEVWKDRANKSQVKFTKIILDSGFKTQYIHKKPKYD